jgi:hypothetical protein
MWCQSPAFGAGTDSAVSFTSTTRSRHDIQVSEPNEIENMPMHPSIRLRIAHYLEHRPEPVIA